VIFVDTSFWIAAQMQEDDRHRDAICLREIMRNRAAATSNQVRGEAWTFLRRRRGHRAAFAFLDLLDRSPRVQVHRITEDLEQEALAWLRRHDERPYSFVDATSFALMRSLGIREALAFDGDFAAAGFVELRP